MASQKKNSYIEMEGGSKKKRELRKPSYELQKYYFSHINIWKRKLDHEGKG